MSTKNYTQENQVFEICRNIYCLVIKTMLRKIEPTGGCLQSVVKIFTPVFLIILPLFLTSCGFFSKDTSSTLTITGSSTLAPVISEIGKEFEKAHPGFRVDVHTGGSSRGLHDIRNELTDIGMVSRAPRSNEQDVNWIPIARDGIAIIVHQRNPVRSLSNKQIVEIFTHNITNWKDVGGTNAPITVINKAHGRATLEVFLDYFQLQDKDIHADVIIGDNQQGIKTVAGNPDAIGYVSIGAAEISAQQNPIALISLGDAVPSMRNLKNNSYPLLRTLHLITKSEPEGMIEQFLFFCQSEKAHAVIEKNFFVPVSH